MRENSTLVLRKFKIYVGGASVKSRLVLPFWYRLTWVVPEKGR